MNDLISRQAAIKELLSLNDQCNSVYYTKCIDDAVYALEILPSAQPEQQHGRIFQEIVVEYPSISTYPEYEGKPYFSIKYMENGQEFIGYGTYKPEVLSEYLIKYFMSSVQPEIIRCKDCKHRPYKSEDKQGFGVEFPDEICPCQCEDWWYNWRPDDDWFCANGERRTDD